MATSRKICIVAPGLSIHAKRWADGLHDRGHEVLWVATGGCDAPRNTRARQFIPSAQRGASEGRILSRMKSSVGIYRAIRRFAPDLVHLHYLLGDRWTHLLSRSWRPLVVSVWGSDVALQEAGKSSARVDRRKQDILARASRVTATSRYLAEQTRRRFNQDLPIEVVPFGVDLGRFSLRPQLSPSRESVLGFLKTYSAGYGPHVLLEAMSVLRRRLPNIKLLMHGFGDPEPYRAQALELGLADRVMIKGGLPHEDVPAALQQIDVFCMPSLAESFGVAAVEAAACGLPVVASRTGGIPEVVQDGVTGILVEPGDPLALADALCDLVTDPDRMRTMGEAGRAMVERSFAWSHNLSQMEAVYEEVLSNLKHHG